MKRFWRYLSAAAARRGTANAPATSRSNVTLYRPRLELLEDRTVLASLSSAFDFVNGLAGHLAEGPQKEIHDVLQSAKDLPFVGKELTGVSQIAQPLVDIGGAVQSNLSSINRALASGPAIPALAIDGFTLSITPGAPDSNEVVHALNFELKGQSQLGSFPIQFNLGLGEFFHVRSTGGFSLTVTAGFDLKFSYNDQNAFDLNETPSDRPLSLTVAAVFGSDFKLDAIIGGLLEATATNLGQSRMQGTVSFGIVNDPTNGPTITGPSFDGEAVANFHLQLGLDPDLHAPLNPQLGADLNIDWKFGDSQHPVSFLPGADYAGASFQNFSFDNVYFDIGASIPSFFQPIITSIQKYTKPLQPVLDFFDTELPIVNEFGVHKHFRDLLGTLPAGLGNALDAIELINGLNFNSQSKSVVVHFGSFRVGSNDESLLLRDVSKNLVDLGTDLAGQVADIIPDGLIEEGEDALKEALGGIDDPNLQEFLKADEVTNQFPLVGSHGTPVGIRFPAFEDPENSIFKMLLGRDADLFTYRMPEFRYPLSAELYFGVPGVLGLVLKGSITPVINLSVGYDTKGLRNAVSDLIDHPQSSAADLAGTVVRDIFHGFYFNNDSPGTFSDPTGIYLSGHLDLTAEVAVVGIGGGITLNGAVNLAPSLNKDGTRARLDDIVSTLFDGGTVFQASGDISAHADVSLEVLGVKVFNYQLGNETLFTFDTFNHSPAAEHTQTFPRQIVLNESNSSDQTIIVGPYVRVVHMDQLLVPDSPGNDTGSMELEEGIEVSYTQDANPHAEFYPIQHRQVPITRVNSGVLIHWGQSQLVPFLPGKSATYFKDNPYYIITLLHDNFDGLLLRPATGDHKIIINSKAPRHVLLGLPGDDRVAASAERYRLDIDDIAGQAPPDWTGLQAFLAGGSGDDDLEFHVPEGQATLIGESGNDQLIGGRYEYATTPVFMDSQNTVHRLDIAVAPDIVDSSIVSVINLTQPSTSIGHAELIPSNGGGELWAGDRGSYLRTGTDGSFLLFGRGGADFFDVRATPNHVPSVTINGRGGRDTVHVSIGLDPITSSDFASITGLSVSGNGGDQIKLAASIQASSTSSTVQNTFVTVTGIRNLSFDYSGSISLPDPTTMPNVDEVLVTFSGFGGQTLQMPGVVAGSNLFSIAPDRGRDVVVTNSYDTGGARPKFGSLRVTLRGIGQRDSLVLSTAHYDVDGHGNHVAPDDSIQMTLNAADTFFQTRIEQFAKKSLTSVDVTADEFSGDVSNSITIKDNEIDWSAVNVNADENTQFIQSGKLTFPVDAGDLTLRGSSDDASSVLVDRPTAAGTTTILGGGATTYTVNNCKASLKIYGGAEDDEFIANGTGSYLFDGTFGENAYTINVPTVPAAGTQTITINDQDTDNLDHLIINGQPASTNWRYTVAATNVMIQKITNSTVPGGSSAPAPFLQVNYQRLQDLTLNTDKPGGTFGESLIVASTSVPTTINMGPGALNHVYITPTGKNIDTIRGAVTVNGSTGANDRTSLEIFDQNNSYSVLPTNTGGLPQPGSETYTISTASLSRPSGFGGVIRHVITSGIGFNNVQKIALHAGEKQIVSKAQGSPFIQANTFNITAPNTAFLSIDDFFSHNNPSLYNGGADTFNMHGVRGQVELNVGSSRSTMRLDGVLDLNPVATAAVLAATRAVGASIWIIDNDGRSNIAGTFSNLAEGGIQMLGGMKYQFTYAAKGDAAPKDSSFVHVNTPPAIQAVNLNPTPVHKMEQLEIQVNAVDPDPLDTLTTTINWDDGSSSTAVPQHGGTGFPRAFHTYKAPGSYAIRISVTDGHGTTTQTVSIRVLDTPLVLTNVAPQLFEGPNDNVVLATFTDAGGDGTTAGYKAGITWGDGAVTDGTVIATGLTSFEVVGSHQYAGDEGTVYTPTVTVEDTFGAKAYGPLSWQASVNDLVTRQGAVAVRGADGVIYVAGGVDASGRPLTAFERFDPVTGAWTQLASVPQALRGATIAADTRGSIYLFGGDSATQTTLNRTYRYDPAANKWSIVAGIPQATSFAAAVTGRDGLIYVVGGQRYYLSVAGLKLLRILNNVQVYDPTKNQWSTRLSMPTARSHLAAALGSEGRIYAMGGQNSSNPKQPGVPLATVEVFDPMQTAWSVGPSMVRGRADFSAVAGPPRFIYALGGDQPQSAANGSPYYTVEAFDPKIQSWFPEAGLEIRRKQFAAASTTDGRIYAIGGLVNVHASGVPIYNLSNTVDVLQAAHVTLQDAPLLASGSFTVQATRNTSFTATLAQFQDRGSEGATADYVGTIHWGDLSGSSSSATFQLTDGGAIAVVGTHLYDQAGSYTVSIDVQDHGASVSLTAHVTVSSGVTLTDATAPASVSAKEGDNTGTMLIGTFDDSDPNAQESDFTNVTIDWHDGPGGASDVQLATVQLMSRAANRAEFQVLGAHVFAEEGTYSVHAHVQSGGQTLTMAGITFNVADPALVRADLLAFASLAIPGTSNIFAAGHNFLPTDGSGTFPSSLTFEAAGQNEYVEFPQLTGGVSFAGGDAFTGPDGSTITPIDNNAAFGISGIRQDNFAKFLVGVFLSDAEPSGAAPASLDFTGNTSFTDLSPLLNQTFFIGDGLTGTAVGTLQRFHVPLGATHLFLGFADGNYTGLAGIPVDPAAYNDNSGQFSATVLVHQAPFVAAIEGTSVTAQLAAFADPGGLESQGDYSATIQWSSDPNDTSAGTIGIIGNTINVSGTHTYAESGNYPLLITMHHDSSAPLIVSGIAMASDATLTDQSQSTTLNAQVGVAFTGAVAIATILDANPAATASDFHANIDWGDGSGGAPDVTAGTVSLISTGAAGALFSVTGQHTFGGAGTFTAHVTFSDNGGQSITSSKTTFQVSSVSSPPTFAPSLTTLAPATGPLATADFNGDGKLDLFTCDDTTFAVLLGDGTGQYGFAPGSPFTVPSYKRDVVIAKDFNGDGKVDVLLTDTQSTAGTSTTGRTLTFLVGDGTGRLSPAVNSPIAVGTPTQTSADGVSDVESGDFNNDGKPDVGVVDRSNGTIHILMNSGTGVFTEASGSPMTLAAASSLAVADFNGDGKQDIAIATAGGTSALTIMLGDGTGTFTLTPNSPFPCNFGLGFGAVRVMATDLRGNGKLDLVVMSDFHSTTGVSILLGNGDGTFGAASVIAGGFQGMIATDVNGDGFDDLVLATSSQLFVLPGDGSGNFALTANTPRFGTSFVTNPVSLTSGDINNDGKPDFIMSGFGVSFQEKVVTWLNTTI